MVCFLLGEGCRAKLFGGGCCLCVWLANLPLKWIHVTFSVSLFSQLPSHPTSAPRRGPKSVHLLPTSSPTNQLIDNPYCGYWYHPFNFPPARLFGHFFQHHREPVSQTEGARLLEPPFQYHPTRLVGHCRGKGPSRVFGVGSTMSFISWDWSSAFRFSFFQRCWQTNKWSCCSEEDKDRSSSGWRRLSYHCNSWDSSSRRNVFIWEFLQSFVDDSGYFQNH